MTNSSKINIKDQVQEYYGKILTHSNDLKTNACCTSEGPNKKIKKIISDIHEEVNNRYYGCGLILPQVLEGMKILDLGSGSGRDVYVLSKLVGEKGYVAGVDMTDEQLNIANTYIDYHTKKYGYFKPNVEFKKGYIEFLDELGFEENSFDIIVSNCVLNLSPDKEDVLRGVYKLLKPGGEFYFSDVYSDRRMPENLINNPILYGECLSGALYTNDFTRLARKVGFNDPRVFESSPITINNEELEKLCGEIKFQSITYRLFKIDKLEDLCEDYGQAVVYKGTIPDFPSAFDLDDHHHIEKGKFFAVCGNTYRMLNETRFAEHFDFYGTWETHYGIFPDCGSPAATDTDNTASSSSCGC